MRKLRATLGLLLVSGWGACGVYSPYGAQTSGAGTFSVEAFEVVTPLASATAAQFLADGLRDRVQRQSTLRLVDRSGELQFAGEIVRWEITPVNIQSDETAAMNRLTVGLALHYTNKLDEELSMTRTFARFADYPSEEDLLSVEDALLEDISDQLSQDIFNATLGNW